MKSLKVLAYSGSMVNICVGSVLLIKGFKEEGAIWTAIFGALCLSSGIMNIVYIRLGVLDALRVLHLRLSRLFGQQTK